ncbi:hypothetical protein HD806DRAFT_513123 [Xylariaceae sp. AK1471]|nr:hypothetical protein HD806DRAFT_513123 [Xylariaceae sp. AK1471]
MMIESPSPIPQPAWNDYPPQQQYWLPEPPMDYNNPLYYTLRPEQTAYPEDPLLNRIPEPHSNYFGDQGLPADPRFYPPPLNHFGPPPSLMAPVQEPYATARSPRQGRWTANRLREQRKKHYENENRRSSEEVSSPKKRNVKPRRPPQPKGEIKPVIPGEELDEPLSKLAAKSKSVKVFDIDEFVRRDADWRLKGVEGAWIPTRPLNAFILYRKTYGKFVESLKGTANNTCVSRIVGASWRAEDKEVKDRFRRYARIEEENHRLAFPDYKYKPGKSRAKVQQQIEEEDGRPDLWHC